MRCVSYTRFTSCLPENKIPKNIIQEQNDRIQNMARSKGWTISKKYSDRKNDATEETAFLQLKADGMSKKYDMVLLDSFYRLGRNISLAKHLLYEVLYPTGIHFLIVEDNFCSLSGTEEEIKDYFKKKYDEYRLKKRWISMMDSRENGLFNVHDERYGYLLSEDRKALLIDKEVEPIIQKIFNLSADGITLNGIADILNGEGVETPSAHSKRVSRKKRNYVKGSWTGDAVSSILNCRQYLGQTRKKTRDGYVLLDIPKIVDTEVFLKAEEIRKKRHMGPVKRSRRLDNAFRTLIRDQDTNQSLPCRWIGGERGSYCFYLESIGWSKKIPYETVEEAVKARLGEENKAAIYISAILRSQKGIRELEERKEKIRNKAYKLTHKMEELSGQRMQLFKDNSGESDDSLMENDSRLREANNSFQQCMDQIKVLDKSFMDNPWLHCFREIEIPKKLDNHILKQWINRIWVKDFETVRVELKHSEWKHLYPSEWFQKEV